MASDSVASQPAILLIRFAQSDFKAYRNSVKKGKSVMHNYGGREIAIAPKIGVLRGEMPEKYGFGVLYFASVKNAERWLYSENIIRQQDWLGGIDIACVPIISQPETEKIFWAVSDVRVFEPSRIPELDQLDLKIKEHGASIIAKAHALKWRGTWSPEMLIVEQWPCLEAFKAFAESDAARAAAELVNGIADAQTFVFQHEDIVSGH